MGDEINKIEHKEKWNRGIEGEKEETINELATQDHTFDQVLKNFNNKDNNEIDNEKQTTFENLTTFFLNETNNITPETRKTQESQIRNQMNSIGWRNVFEKMLEDAPYLTLTGEKLIDQGNNLQEKIGDKQDLLNSIDEDTSLINIRDIINKPFMKKDINNTKENEEREKNTIEENKPKISKIIQSINAKIDTHNKIQTEIEKKVPIPEKEKNEISNKRKDMQNALDKEYEELNKAYEDYKESKDARGIMRSIQKIKPIVTYWIKKQLEDELTSDNNRFTELWEKVNEDKDTAKWKIIWTLDRLNI